MVLSFFGGGRKTGLGEDCRQTQKRDRGKRGLRRLESELLFSSFELERTKEIHRKRDKKEEDKRKDHIRRKLLLLFIFLFCEILPSIDVDSFLME